MIIVCPACSAKYAVPASAISEEGRKVRCSDCGHSWRQLPLDKVADLSDVKPPPKKVAPMQKGSNLPAQRIEPVPASMKYNAAAMLIVALFISFFTYQPKLEKQFAFTKGIYTALGLPSSDKVAFKDITATFTQENNRLKMTFSGLLANESPYDQKHIQPISVSVLSEGGNRMGSVEYKPETKLLEPGEEMAIGSSLGGISGNGKTVVIEYGNWLEKLFY